MHAGVNVTYCMNDAAVCIPENREVTDLYFIIIMNVMAMVTHAAWLPIHFKFYTINIAVSSISGEQVVKLFKFNHPILF